MKKKYLNLYIIDSVVTFLILILFLVLGFVKKSGSVFNFTSYLSENIFTDILIVVAISLFIVVILLLKKKYTLDVNSLFLPISYLAFTGLIIVVALILNCYVIIKNMHFVYFYRFIIFDYLLLNGYTLLSFKK